MTTDQFTNTLVSWAVVHNTGQFNRVQTIITMYIIVHQIVGIAANFEPILPNIVKVVIKTLVSESSNFSPNFSEVLRF